MTIVAYESRCDCPVGDGLEQYTGEDNELSAWLPELEMMLAAIDVGGLNRPGPRQNGVTTESASRKWDRVHRRCHVDVIHGDEVDLERESVDSGLGVVAIQHHGPDQAVDQLDRELEVPATDAQPEVVQTP